MFNKLKFNNLVISNKKGIQQARIQTINKLVHKIRKLKTLSEKQPDNIKCKERIRKSMETMEVIKKLKRMDIMKKLLLMDKPAAAIITNGTSIPEEIAAALLSMNKAMQNMIKKFKTELKIIELESDDWKQVLMETSKRKRKIERTEEKRRKRLELKQQKAMGRKREEWLEENQTKTEHLPIETDGNVSTIGGWQIDELSNDETVTEDNEAKNVPTKEIKRKMKEKDVTKRTVLTNKKQKSIKAEQLSSAENDLIAEKKDTKESNSTGENIEMPNPNVREKEEENEESLVIDPFFITETGESYLSTAINKKENSEENNGKRELHIIKLDKFDRKRFEFNESRNEKRQQSRNKWESQDRQSKQKVNKHNRNDKLHRKQFADKNNDQIRQKRSDKKDLTNINDGKLIHPSWAAKQKLKPIITEFKGRKTTFDDLNTENIYTENDIKYKRPSPMKFNSSEKDSLHPSWAAKQKLKPSITAFQGKKITFDIDE